jgi:hypothetical protein
MEQTYRMSKRWLNNFMSNEKKGQGWKLLTIENDVYLITKPDGTRYGIYERPSRRLIKG